MTTRRLGWLIAVVFVAGLAGAWVEADGDFTDLDGSDDRPPHPDVWDERVFDIAAFVAEARGLDFDHPVFVDFLDEDEYSAQTRVDAGLLDDDDRQSLRDQAAMLRALGLAEGDVDLLDAQNETSDAGTLAFYRPDDARVRVRGTELTVGVRVTLAHELTHALHDQHFDLERLTDSAAPTVYRALLEGDAVRMENAYVADGLAAADRERYQAEISSAIERSATALDGVAPAVVALAEAPYALGQPLISILATLDGNRAVDVALDDPPGSEEALLDPVTFLVDDVGGRSGEDGPLEIDVPGDAAEIDGGRFGALTWYLVLAERIEPVAALAAVDGWADDGFAGYTTADGTVCVRVEFEGDSGDDVSEMRDAIVSWSATFPTDSVEPATENRPGFTACDPGADARLDTTGRVAEALALPAVRSVFTGDLVTAYGLDLVTARCAAHGIVTEVGFARLVADDQAFFATDDFAAAVTDGIAACADG